VDAQSDAIPAAMGREADRDIDEAFQNYGRTPRHREGHG
jgi:hypothetical protein